MAHSTSKTEIRTADSEPGKYDYNSDKCPSEIYQTGERGGYPKHEIDWDKFNAELMDLLYRYGGVDLDDDGRLRAHVTDIVEEYQHHFLPVRRITEKTTNQELWESIDRAKTNVKIATEQLQWAIADARFIKRESKK